MLKPSFCSRFSRTALVIGFTFFLTASGVFAQSNPWRAVPEASIAAGRQREFTPKFYRTVALDASALTSVLGRAPMEFTAAAGLSATDFYLPKPDGTFERFRLVESPVISAAVAKERPDYKTYAGHGIDDPSAVMRMSWSNEGFRAYVLGKDGAFFVDPYSKNEREYYMVYAKDDAAAAAKGAFHCALDRYFSESGTGADKAASPAAAIMPEFSTGANLRTYRLAVATTGEYTVARGGQASALASVMDGVNRINLVYRRDLSVALTLVSGTNLIYPDPNTDPYNNTDEEAQLNINHMNIVSVIGVANFDIGHLFGTGGGGVASSPSVCDDTAKGEGYSARGTTTGDPFFIDYVAHEMGHQLSAAHTYNNADPNGACTTRSAMNAYEVASGSTIMSYVGICNERNLQQFTDDMFHVRSLTQIINYVNNSQGNTCGSVTPTNNMPPTVSAGPNYTIPKQTPFTLSATASDPNTGDMLTYSWEEYDLAPSASGVSGTPAGTYDVDSDGILRPLFRAYKPIASPSRTYPTLSFILNNANVPPLTFTGTSPTGAVCETGATCVTGENLPTVTRTMNFRVTVRDNQTGIADSGMQLMVDGGSGPFRVTAPNTAVTVNGGAATTVTWDVANTTAAPVSAANVKISLSTDGGMTFPTVLAASTANDGSESVTIPNNASSTARIKVEAVGNIFFDISDTNFTISAGGGAPVPTSAVSRKVHGAAGTFDLNLPLVGISGAVGIEPRNGPVSGTYQMVITFANPVTVNGAGVTTGTGNATFSVNGAVVTVDLTGVTDVQRLGVTLSGVNDGMSTGDVLIPMGILVGNTTGNGSVTASSVSQTKSQAGVDVTASNFRNDVNASGAINSSDIGTVKSKSGNILPP